MQISCLLAALVIMLAVYFMKEMGEKRMFFYLVPAVVIWGCSTIRACIRPFRAWRWPC